MQDAAIIQPSETNAYFIMRRQSAKKMASTIFFSALYGLLIEYSCILLNVPLIDKTYQTLWIQRPRLRDCL